MSHHWNGANRESFCQTIVCGKFWEQVSQKIMVFVFQMCFAVPSGLHYKKR